MLEASQEGDNRNVDMLVGDIYGTDYSKIGLKSTTIASSMGKVFKKNVDKRSFKSEDISRSLLYMVRYVVSHGENSLSHRRTVPILNLT